MVIQIPNPLLLPQSYGMGEIAGMAFGSNYVIMMQIGYRYYAPRIIEEMEKDNLDNPLNTVWWNKWQKFMKIYSDKSITNTMDRTLEMPEQALKAIWDKIFNILPSQDTTLTTGGGADDDVTFIRGGRPRTETDKERQERFLREAEERRRQEEQDRNKKKTIKKSGLTQADKVRLAQTIGINQRAIKKKTLLQKKKLAEVKGLYVLISKAKGFSNQSNRLKWGRRISIVRIDIRELDNQIQALRGANKVMERNLRGSGGLKSF